MMLRSLKSLTLVVITTFFIVGCPETTKRELDNIKDAASDVAASAGVIAQDAITNSPELTKRVNEFSQGLVKLSEDADVGGFIDSLSASETQKGWLLRLLSSYEQAAFVDPTNKEALMQASDNLSNSMVCTARAFNADDVFNKSINSSSVLSKFVELVEKKANTLAGNNPGFSSVVSNAKVIAGKMSTCNGV